MSEPETGDPIRDYVRRYRDQYTGAQLRDQLELAGHDRATIDEVFAELGVQDGRLPGGHSPAGISGVGAPVGFGQRPVVGRDAATSWLTLIGFVAGTYAATYVVGMAAPNAAMAVALIGLVLGSVGWAALQDSHPSAARGLGWGVIAAIGLPVLALAVLFGMCAVGAIRPY